MIRVTSTIWFIVLATISFGQSFDEIVKSNRYVNCQDITYNAYDIISDFYSRNEIDSIYNFLDYWESKCGSFETSSRLKHILNIKQGKFDSNLISEDWIESLLSYQRKVNHFDSRNRWHYNYSFEQENDYSIKLKKIDGLIKKIAGSITETKNKDEFFLLDFYTIESPSFDLIKQASPEESKLKYYYDKVYFETLGKPQLHLALVSGYVQNFGKIALFGTRPTFGFVMGGKQLRHNYDLILDFRAGPAKREYTVIYNNQPITQRSWTGMYLGLEYAFDILKFDKIDVSLATGGGYDRITALTRDNDFGEEPKFLNGYNYNIGIACRFRIRGNGAYIGLHGRYNFTGYNNEGGTELDGNYFNLRLTFGSISDYFRDNRLKQLQK